MRYLYAPKLVLALLLMAFGLFSFSQGLQLMGFMMFGMALVSMFAHLVFGQVFGAYKAIAQERKAKAIRQLNATFSPNLLVGMHRSYYWLTWSIIHAQNKRFEQSEHCLIKAVEIGKMRKRDQIMALVNLAQVFISRGQFKEGQAYLTQLETFQITDLRIKKMVQQLNQTIISSN